MMNNARTLKPSFGLIEKNNFKCRTKADRSTKLKIFGKEFSFECVHPVFQTVHRTSRRCIVSPGGDHRLDWLIICVGPQVLEGERARVAPSVRRGTCQMGRERDVGQ